MKAVMIWMCTVFCAAGLWWCGTLLTKDNIYTGTEIVFSTSRNLSIEAESAVLEAVAPGFFYLRKETGEIIAGVPTQPPLGWTQGDYFVFGPQEIPGGEWLFPADGPRTAYKITSNEPITVRAVMADPGFVWFFLSVLVVGLWLLLIRLITNL